LENLRQRGGNEGKGHRIQKDINHTTRIEEKLGSVIDGEGIE
jgi:hypothetical protein